MSHENTVVVHLVHSFPRQKPVRFVPAGSVLEGGRVVAAVTTFVVVLASFDGKLLAEDFVVGKGGNLGPPKGGFLFYERFFHKRFSGGSISVAMKDKDCLNGFFFVYFGSRRTYRRLPST